MSDIQAQARRDAEFDRLLAKCDGVAEVAPVQEAYEMGKRHGIEQCPLWHDAPTCAGLWVNDGEAYEVMIVKGVVHINLYGTVVCSGFEGRWFGPIPSEAKP